MSASLAARTLGDLHGRKVYRFPVRVKCNSSRLLGTVAEYVYLVHSYAAADAADLIKAVWADRPETEITVYGPKGGKAAYRYVGYESSIWHQMIRRPAGEQLRLPIGRES